MPVLIAENPLDSVVLGSGRCVDEFDALQPVLGTQSRR
jgi:rod shape-determining protein MreB